MFINKKTLLYILSFLSFCIFLYFILDNRLFREDKSWTVHFEGIGSSSSPRLADLNNDGALDIIVGAGGKETEISDFAVIALDGTNGDLLWHVSGIDQLVGSALLKDITNDGIVDVFIGGRSGELMAIDGHNGNLIWKYQFITENANSGPASSFSYIFYNPQFIPDQNNDGMGELLISYGGYADAPPHDPNRPAGKLMVLNSMNGSLIAEAEVPDGKEIYMSVVVVDFDKTGDLSIIFGTGGETIGGNLYKTTLKNLLDNDISTATLLLSGGKKGFMAPPVLADITEDGIYDIIVNAYDGRMIAIDGSNDSIIWQIVMPRMEAYPSLAVGQFTEDSIPDFFTNYGMGTWPNLKRSIQILVNGKNGGIISMDTLGTFQFSTPVVADFNNDGHDDALLGINDFHQYYDFSTLYNKLMVFNFQDDTIYQLGETTAGANLYSTPWIGDMDGDGYLDIVHCIVEFRIDMYTPVALHIKRIATDIKLDSQISWGAYMGNNYDGIYK